jgi:hypothetical protein
MRTFLTIAACTRGALIRCTAENHLLQRQELRPFKQAVTDLKPQIHTARDFPDFRAAGRVSTFNRQLWYIKRIQRQAA